MRRSLRRLLAVARKECLHVLRDPWSLGLAIVIPMVMLLLFGYALTLDVDRVPMAVWDQSETPASRELISRFTGSRYFAIRSQVSSYREIERAIDTDAALVGMVVPREFAGELDSGRDVSLQMIFDGSDANTATLAMSYARSVIQDYSQHIALRQLQRKGQRALVWPLDLRARMWFNEDMESRNFIVPGLIAMSMMVIAALLTSLTVAREWERGTMEQLISTPIRSCELIIGKLIPYFVIGMLDMLIIVIMGRVLFHVPLRGSLVLLFGASAVFLTGVLALGLLISIASRSQLLASQLAMITTFLPAFLLSGFIYPIANMPMVIQAITYLIPARYFIELLRGIYLKGLGPRMLIFNALPLVLFATAMVGLSILKFKKKLV